MRKCGPTVAMVSLGCPKNLVDSEMLLAHLAEAGCVVNAPFEQADVILVNTCGFLASARSESLTVIREAVQRKQAGRTQRVVVAGCLVNRDGRALYEKATGVDAIVGVNDRDEIVRAVLGPRRVTMVSDMPHRKSGRLAGAGGRMIASDAGRLRLTPKHTAYLRISEGCSQKCSFCAIPSIRGPYRSKPPADVLAEARELAADGAVELNVIGQDTTAYGSDFPMEDGRGMPKSFSGLAWLLRALNDVDGVKWIRLLYTYPRRFTDELIEAIAQCQRVVPYVDMPLQHASDDILRRMGRGVTRAATERLLEKLRARVPGVAIRTTFIVGFPGETESQFRELVDFVKANRFDAAGVFAFSPEEGTRAARMQGAIPEAVRAARMEELMLVQQGIAFEANRRRKGQELTVLVDGVDSQGRCVARHAGQAPDVDSVCLLPRRRDAGRFVRTVVTGYDGYDLLVKAVK